MKRKKLDLMNVGDEEILSRDEMKHIMAGSGGNDCAEGPMSDIEFCQTVGCKASDRSTDTCSGSDGCTYSWATGC